MDELMDRIAPLVREIQQIIRLAVQQYTPVVTEIGRDPLYRGEQTVLEEYADLLDRQTEARAARKAAQEALDRVSQTLTGRIRELAERYATPLPALVDEVERLAARVEAHLRTMGASWR